MKKTMLILLAFTMVLYAGAAFAATYTADGYCTIEYDDALEFDNTSFLDENTDTNIWLFMLQNDDYVIDVYISAIDGYGDFDLSEADSDEISAYIEEVTTTFADLDASMVGMVNTVSGMLFYIFRFEDSDGAYYNAETIYDGYCVNFFCYYLDWSLDTDDNLLNDLVGVVETYTRAEADEAADDQTETEVETETQE